jgi:RimJ/RimL family protein N-acetyltransferase
MESESPMTLSRLFIGAKVRLTALSKDDAPTITGWYLDSDLSRLYDAAPAHPRSQSRWEKWLETRDDEKDAYYFAIRPLDGEALLGVVDLSGILWTHGTCWLAIAIGDPAQRGKGFGSDALRLALDFAFQELNLHRVQLTAFAYNAAAIRLYEKLGFTREGVYREFLHRDGQRYDMLLYGLLRREWEAQASSQAT